MFEMGTELFPFTILSVSSEKVLSPLFEDSVSESSPSLLSVDEIRPETEKYGEELIWLLRETGSKKQKTEKSSYMRRHCRPP